MEEIISIEDKIAHLRNSLEKRITCAFHDVVKDATDKIDVIVTFLALLEMIKQKIVSFKQEELFGKIEFKKLNQESRSVNHE